MIVTIHQPEHLPWLGFCNKVDQADVYVVLDTVQYRTNYFQNRNRILASGAPAWLTVPVQTRGHLGRTLAEMEVTPGRWGRRNLKTLTQAYGSHPFWSAHAPFFEKLFDASWRSLVELNVTAIEYLLDALGIETEIVMASRLSGTGTRSERLANLCAALGADEYLAGQSAPDYLDDQPFVKRGIAVTYHRFAHPTYPQRGSCEFVDSLSVVDLLMNCGADSLDVIRTGSLLEPQRDSRLGVH